MNFCTFKTKKYRSFLIFLIFWAQWNDKITLKINKKSYVCVRCVSFFSLCFFFVIIMFTYELFGVLTNINVIKKIVMCMRSTCRYMGDSCRGFLVIKCRLSPKLLNSLDGVFIIQQHVKEPREAFPFFLIFFFFS